MPGRASRGFHGGRQPLLDTAHNREEYLLYVAQEIFQAGSLPWSSMKGVHTQESLVPNPERMFNENANREVLEQALQQLPAEFRESIVLRELEGLSYKEISEIAGVPVGTVMSRLSRARVRLARLHRSRHRRWRINVRCTDAQTLIESYVDGELDVVHTVEIEQHLGDCSICAPRHQGVIELRSRIRERGGPLFPERRQNLQQRIGAIASGEKSGASRSLVPLWAWSGAIAAVVLFAVITSGACPRKSFGILTRANDHAGNCGRSYSCSLMGCNHSDGCCDALQISIR